MKQLEFEQKHHAFWQDFTSILNELNGQTNTENNLKYKFPQYYRKLCQHYSIAQSRQYSPVLTDYLHNLVTQGHQHLYAQKSSILLPTIHFIVKGFPIALRKNWRSWLISSALFYIPAIFMGLMCFFQSEFLYTLIDFENVQDIEYMYNPNTDRIGRSEGRQSDSDFMMFGYYIMNNIGIDFKAYASGILFGLGSIFFIVFNGLYLGGVAGHLTNKGYIETFWPFVSGHSALELTALTIAGAGGLKLGYALINPKGYSRLLALKKASIETFPLITGAALMTFLAAFVEGFWSATPNILPEIKYTVGALSWLALFSYLLLSGRRL